MNRVNILTHEIGPDCNLALEHKEKCPSFMDRYKNVNTSKVLEDDEIVSNAEYAYSLGFNGVLAWHYYNEPLLYIDRIERVFEKVKQKVPQARHVLWTNGTLIENEVDLDRLSTFSSIIISRYERERDWSKVKSAYPRMALISGRLDNRLVIGEFSRNKCLRPYNELPIDYYGNYRLCCGNYNGTASNLNVYTDGFKAIVDQHIYLRSLLEQEPLPDSVPDVCYRCSIRGSRCRR